MKWLKKVVKHYAGELTKQLKIRLFVILITFFTRLLIYDDEAEC